MGINNEYRDDAFTGVDDVDDAYDEQEDHEIVLGPQDWHDWQSEDVLNMWMSLRQYLEENHMNNTLMNKASFHDFAEFVRQFSQ